MDSRASELIHRPGMLSMMMEQHVIDLEQSPYIDRESLHTCQKQRKFHDVFMDINFAKQDSVINDTVTTFQRVVCNVFNMH